MSNQNNATVTSTKIQSTDPKRLGKFDYIITYKTTNPVSYYSFMIPAENATKATIEAAIKKHYSDNKITIPFNVKLG